MTDRDGFPFTFGCRRSGNCCSRPGGVVRVTPAEVGAIASYLDLSEAAFRSRYLAAAGDRLREGPDTRCVFLDDGGCASCAIYPARPRQCRQWPFRDELRDPEAARAASRFCPGIEMTTGA